MHAANGQGELSVPGLSISAVLVVIYFLFNFWSVKVFAGTNSAITFFKLIVPAATAIALMCTGFHWENFHVGVHGGPHVGNVASILTAVATSGIVFSYNGFQSPVNLAGEARNPGRSVPFAIFGSIALSTVVYLMLQVAFLGAVAPEHLHEGWAALEYSSPFAQLALALNLNWLALLLYADAFVSPSGTGTTYTATTARMIYAMERSGTVPEVFGRVHPRFGIPRPAMWFNLVVSFIFLFFFRGWGKLAAVISVATIITYLVVPISVMVLRRTAPDLHRPLRVPGLHVLAPMAFVLATLMLFWARWPHTGEIMLLLILPMPVYLYYQAKAGWRDFGRQLRGAWWLIAYLAADRRAVLGRQQGVRGHDYIGYGWDQLCVALAALVFYFWGVRSGWRTPAIEAAETAKKTEAPSAPLSAEPAQPFNTGVPTGHVTAAVRRRAANHGWGRRSSIAAAATPRSAHRLRAARHRCRGRSPEAPPRRSRCGSSGIACSRGTCRWIDARWRGSSCLARRAASRCANRRSWSSTSSRKWLL